MLIGYTIRLGNDLLDVDLDVEKDEHGNYLDGIYLNDFPLHDLLQQRVIDDIAENLDLILRDYYAETRISRFKDGDS